MSDAEKIQLAGELFLERKRLEGEVGALRAKLSQVSRRLRQVADSLDGILGGAQIGHPHGEAIQGQVNAAGGEGIGALVDEYRESAKRLEQVTRDLEDIG